MSSRSVVLYCEPFALRGHVLRAALRHKGMPFREVTLAPTWSHLLSVGNLGGNGGPAGADAGGKDTDREAYLETNGHLISTQRSMGLALDEQKAEPALVPSDPALRDRVLLLESWAEVALAPIIEAVRWGNRVNRRRLINSITDSPAWTGPKRRALALLRPVRAAGLRFSYTEPARDIHRLSIALDRIDASLGSSGYLVGDGPTIADLVVVGLVGALRGLDGWETIKMRRKVTKLVKTLLPEPSDGAKERKAAPAPVIDGETDAQAAERVVPAVTDRDQEAYDAADQAFIEASRLRRITAAEKMKNKAKA